MTSAMAVELTLTRFCGPPYTGPARLMLRHYLDELQRGFFQMSLRKLNGIGSLVESSRAGSLPLRASE